MPLALHAFISHTACDQDVARSLASALRALDISSYVSAERPLGVNFEAEITAHMERATHVVALMSEGALHSAWVQREIALAVRQAKPVLVIRVEPRLRLQPLLRDDVNQLELTRREVSPADLMRFLVENRVFDDGIVRAAFLRAATPRLPNEAFAAELLAQPVRLRREDGRLTVSVDRRGVEHVVISNRGKSELCRAYVEPQRAALIEADQRLHRFLLGAAPRQREIELPRLPMRWGSGGVLSVVNRGGRRWVPLFFRDIPPLGWNLSLGASQREFDPALPNADPGRRWQEELTHPWGFIEREFLEEMLVLDQPPRRHEVVGRRRFVFTFPIEKDAENLADRFSARHLALREQHDAMNIEESPHPIVVRAGDRSGVDIVVTQAGHRAPAVMTDVLVALNLLELGIEVVRVLEYGLGPEDLMLDGEIVDFGEGAGDALVRMPVALVSESYLQRAFAKPADLRYTTDAVQPSVQAPSFGPGDIVVFDWDLRRRAELAHPERGDEIWRRRWQHWREAFAANFKAARYPALFTPAAAKILSYWLRSRRP